MRILFFTTLEADYLQDSVLHGLRLKYGSNLIDFPKKNILYKNYSDNDIYGRGFTLYKLLDDIEVDRENVDLKLQRGLFDLIVFGSIHRQKELFYSYEKLLSKKNTILLDGEDAPVLFPNHRLYKIDPSKLFKSKCYNNYFYFKREITNETNHYRYFKLLPEFFTSIIKLPKLLKPISFSIPEEKIVKELPQKTKLFPTHIVDEEVASKVEGSFTKYAFYNEEDYYKDLQASKFGITTKRAGWDCMRHYEIAANGAVICFRDLDKKPDTCAPHGLIDGINSISYKHYDDLIYKINKISEEDYRRLQLACLSWVKQNITIKRACEILDKINLLSLNK